MAPFAFGFDMWIRFLVRSNGGEHRSVAGMRSNEAAIVRNHSIVTGSTALVMCLPARREHPWTRRIGSGLNALVGGEPWLNQTTAPTNPNVSGFGARWKNFYDGVVVRLDVRDCSDLGGVRALGMIAKVRTIEAEISVGLRNKTKRTRKL
jgi:hypothetical protein